MNLRQRNIVIKWKSRLFTRNVSYSQRSDEESFFSLEQLPNTHEGEKLMKET